MYINKTLSENYCDIKSNQNNSLIDLLYPILFTTNKQIR